MIKKNVETKGSYQFEKLEGRHQEASFLAERASMRLDTFVEVIKKHGLKNGDKVLEVGCGQGIRSALIAKNFPQCHVTAIDRSAELLMMAHERSSAESYSNLKFQEANLYELPFADDSFDFIYVRLVFMHLDKPHAALESLKRVLKPGGRILIEDADRDCMFFEPTPASFKIFWPRVLAGQRRLGGDPNVGRKLAPYLKELNFENLEIETQSILGGRDEIEFLARTLMPSLNVYLDRSEREQGLGAIEDLKIMANDSRATFYHFWFVVSGAKP